jgi:iron complex transport system substrate-binding protein
VLASADAGPPAAMAQVAAAGVAVIRLPEAHTEAAALARVQQVGTALRCEAEAAVILAAMHDDLAQVRADLGRLAQQAGARRPRVLFLLSAGRGAPMAAGSDTAAESMIRLAGGVNAVQGARLYRPLSAEAAILAEPDWIVTTTDTLHSAGGVAGLLAQPGLAATPAGAAGRVLAFDGLYLLGFGPRLAHAVRDLAAALHPDRVLRPLPPRPWTTAP